MSTPIKKWQGRVVQATAVFDLLLAAVALIYLYRNGPGLADSETYFLFAAFMFLGVSALVLATRAAELLGFLFLIWMGLLTMACLALILGVVVLLFNLGDTTVIELVLKAAAYFLLTGLNSAAVSLAIHLDTAKREAAPGVD